MPKLQNAKLLYLRLPKLTDLPMLLLMFLASRCSVLGLFPFGVAMFSSVFDLKIGYLGIIVSFLGYYSIGFQSECIKYIASLLLFWLYSRLNVEHNEEPIKSSIISGVILFTCSIISILYTGISIYDAVLSLIEAVLCAFGYIIFLKARELLAFSRNKSTDEEIVSGALCVGIFVSGLSGIELIPGIEVSKLICCYIVLVCAMHLPVGISGGSGVAAGLLCCLNDVLSVTWMGILGISAMLGSLLKQFKKYGVAIGFLGGSAICILYIGNAVSVSIFEIIIACFLFSITPNKLMKKYQFFFSKATEKGIISNEDKMRDYLENRLKKTELAFLRLSSVFRSTSEKRIISANQDICKIIDEVTFKVCRSCTEYDKCIALEKNEAYRVFYSVLKTIETNGFCKNSNAPMRFLCMCKNNVKFLSELTHEYELYKLGKIKLGEYKNSRDLILSQYENISELFQSMRESISEGFRFLNEAEDKLSTELERNGIKAQSIGVIENGNSEIEVFISAPKRADKTKLREIISDSLSQEMMCIGATGSGLLQFSPAPIYKIELGQKQIIKGCEQVSGDNISCFYVGNSRFYCIICDGMGSGQKAEKESRITARLLEEFLRAGFSVSIAISMINSSLSLNINEECFSSIDLLSIDLFSGNAEFYKLGSSSSYIKHSDSIETVFSPSLPVGIIPDIHISSTSKFLDDSDTVIMMSDGMESGGLGFLSSEKLKRLLADDEKTLDDVAEAIITSGGVNGKKRMRDDMTVAILKLVRL